MGTLDGHGLFFSSLHTHIYIVPLPSSANSNFSLLVSLWFDIQWGFFDGFLVSIALDMEMMHNICHLKTFWGVQASIII